MTKELVDILAYRWGIRSSEEELDYLLKSVLKRRRSKKLQRSEECKKLGLDDLKKQVKVRKRFKASSEFVSKIAEEEQQKIKDEVELIEKMIDYLGD